MRCLKLIAVVLYLSCCGFAQQGFPGSGLIRGEVSLPEGVSADGLVVELHDVANQLTNNQVSLDRDGSFQLHEVPPGIYDIRIVNIRGDVLLERVMPVHEGGVLSLQLSSVGHDRKPQGAVSVSRLLHPIPRDAEKEFIRAMEARENGRLNESVEHLEKAIRIFPAYTEAHNNLGVRLFVSGQNDKAAQEFRTAIALDPACAKAYANLSLVLAAEHHYSDAEEAARRALQLEPETEAGHYALGMALAFGEIDPTEALAHLRRAVHGFPAARLSIADLLMRKGAVDEAVLELQAYLESGKQEHREEVQAWLARLKH